MKAISIAQPFAWAVLHAGKDVENRTWPTDYRGPLLVHAGKTKKWYDAEDPADWREAIGLTLPAWADLPKGAVVGRVDLVDCVRAGDLPYFLPGAGPNAWAEGPWCWVLRNPVAFAAPVPLAGQLGLFDVPDDLPAGPDPAAAAGPPPFDAPPGRVRVVMANGLRTPEQRAGVVYVGRKFAGWPATPFGNHGRRPCPGVYRDHLLRLPPDQLNNMLASLWEACGHGRKPLACWCCSWDGTGPTPGCHAAVWAELLNLRYGRDSDA